MSKSKAIYQHNTSDLEFLVERETKTKIPVANTSAATTSSKEETDNKAKEKVAKTLAGLSATQ